MSADRNLLFGLLALQIGLIDQAQLVAAFQAWTLHKDRNLAEHLVARGDLDADDRSAVEALVERHLKKHGGDVEKSLAAVPAGNSTRESLANLGDPAIEATLGHVGSGHGSTDDGESDRTASYAVGTATSDGLRFRVLRPHARGGLGAVFVALDAELNREVALKQILDRHADDPTSRQRFLLEAEVTGGLEHPGIVPVYGLGAYADGRPYYAMRFIRGDSLKEAIDRFHGDESLRTDPGRRSLELRKLLRRFTDVCNAIDYAHSRGILHRDIKPGNIIVGKHGETLVVDWGLAKPLGHVEPGRGGGEHTLMPSSASGSAETLPGSALGTPAYMSPEQARGDLDSLGPRSDVYSLGATLCCLLAGKPPLEGDDLGELLRKVQRGEFTRPRQVDLSTDAALEAICLKAMALKPEDRYATPRQLADDLDRWMADEPVSSYREPWTRKLTRWLSRHRTGVTAAGAAILMALVGTAAVLVVQSAANARLSAALSRETTAKSELAAANAELTRSKSAVQARYDLAVDAIKTFHTGVSGDFLLKQEQFKELRDRLLRSAADFYGKLGALLGTETDGVSRRVLAQANFELADLTDKVGRKEAALEAHRQVLSARQALAAEPAADAEAKADVGRSLTSVGTLLEETGKTEESLAEYRAAESLLTELAASSPGARAALADCRSRLGLLLSTIGRSAEALAVYRLARSEQAALAGVRGATNEARRDLAVTIQRIGKLLSMTGKPSEAQAEYRQVLAIWQKLADDNPGVTEFRSGLAIGHFNLGSLFSETARLSEAEAEYRKALAIQRKLADDNPAVTEFRFRLARSHVYRGLLLSNTGKLSEAEAECRKALAIQQKLVADNPTATYVRSELATTHIGIGNLLSSIGKGSDAEAEYRAALMLYQKLADDNPAVTEFRSGLASGFVNLGNFLSQTGKPLEGEAEYRKGLAIQQKLVDDNPAVTEFRNSLAISYFNHGWLLSSTGKPSEAEAEHRKALAIQQKLADDNPAVADFRNSVAINHAELGWLLSSTGKPSEAEAEYRMALMIQQKLVDDHPAVTDYRSRLAHSHSNLGWLLSQTGKPSDAEAEFRESLALFRKLADDNPAVTDFREGLASSHVSLGELRSSMGYASEGEGEYRKAQALHQKLADDNSARTKFRDRLAMSHTALGNLMTEAGRFSEAQTEHRKALALHQKLADAEPGNPFWRRAIGKSLNNLGDLDTESVRFDAAIAKFQESRSIHERLTRDNPTVTDYRNGLAFALTGLGRALHRAGRGAEAVDPLRRAIALREAIPNLNIEARYDLARAYALLPSIAADSRSGRCAVNALAEVDRAMAALRQAVAAGYRDLAKLRTDPDLASLRGRDDFRMMMMDLAFPTRPLAR